MSIDHIRHAKSALCVSINHVKKAIRKLDRESTGGISRWDATLLKLASKEEHFMAFLHLLTTLIAKGTAPVTQLLLGARGVALRKDIDGAVRPSINAQKRIDSFGY
jgi:hypothetical protein